MEIKVITISKESLTKENIIPKMDPYVKEYLKKTGDFREAFSLCESMTDEQFNALYHAIPTRYLYIDTGCDEELICNDTILDTLKKFDLAVFWTSKVKRHPIDQFIQHVRDNYNYVRVSNQFDYSHITLATLAILNKDTRWLASKLVTVPDFMKERMYVMLDKTILNKEELK